VQSQRTRTLKHIPQASRGLWAQALTRCLAAVAVYNTVEAWTALEMLPKATLGPPPRGGRQHARAAAAHTTDRLNRWLEGDRVSLWDEVVAIPSAPGSKPCTEASRLRRADALAREGFDRKACAALLSTGVCPENAATARLLRQLHPLAPEPQCLPNESLPMAAVITNDVVSKVLRSFPLDSAPGPSGLRVQHFLESLTPAHGAAVLEQLTAVVQLLARGDAPKEVAPSLAGAGLLALPKAKGGVRPIAIGEVLRRVTGKSLCAAVKDEAQAFFHPSQVGVACPGGVDAAVHTARAWFRRARSDNCKALVKLDFANAFNCVSRKHALDQTVAHFPGLARWTHWCYRHPSRLTFGSYVLSSESGVQQGDPLGPLLFSAAIQPLVERLRELEVEGKKLDLSTFYLDDGFLAGDVQVVAAALALVESEGAVLGLELKMGKCELVLPAGSSSSRIEDLFPSALLTDPDTGKNRVLTDGFELLGAAVGGDAFCEEYASEKAAKAKVLLEQLPKLEDPQVALRLLRLCGGHCKLVHSMRVTPPQQQLDALRGFDQDVRDSFCAITGLLPDDASWDQACRSFHHAGLGLRKTALHAPAAYVASVTSSRDLGHALDSSYTLNSGDASSDWCLALAAVNALLPGDKQLSPATASKARQKEISFAIDEAKHKASFSAACMVDRATLLSECEPGARAFWQATPAKALGLAVDPAEFKCELRARLCMPETTADRWCPLCDAVADVQGHHARMCSAGGDRVLRHNSLRNFIFRFAARAGLHPELEKPGLLVPARPDDVDAALRRPADIYLPSWVNGSPIALDFAVTAPQRQETLADAARNPLAAAVAYSNHKRAYLDTEAACQASGVGFQPMVVETTGAWSPEASKVLWLLAKAEATRSGRETETVLNELLQGAAVCVRRANARAELKRADDDETAAWTSAESTMALVAEAA
jgi:hypothetical protein